MSQEFKLASNSVPHTTFGGLISAAVMENIRGLESRQRGAASADDHREAV